MPNFIRIVTLSLAAVLLGGCAGPVASFIVRQRNHQGDLAISRSNPAEAAIAYKLALRVDPKNVHAREGLATVQLQLAAAYFTQSKLDDALDALAIAAKYDPQSIRLAALRSEIEQAKINREIVLSNYPTYRETGLGLRRSYAQLRPVSNAIVAILQRFDYNFDARELTSAIRTSADLNAEVAHLTVRLKNFRQLVEAGAPDRAATTPLAPATSLLPLP